MSYPVSMTCCCPWSHGLQPKKLSVSVAVPPAPVRVPSQRPLAPSVALVTLVANVKGDNEMILGTVHRFPGVCLTAEENPRKHQPVSQAKWCKNRKWATHSPLSVLSRHLNALRVRRVGIRNTQTHF